MIMTMRKLIERENKLLKVVQKRNELSYVIKTGLITEEDIINLIKKDANYGVRIRNVSKDPKEIMLKNIFNCPFLLCDQENLSPNLKSLLPYFLNIRYQIEKDTLNVYLEQGLIDENEYEEELDNLLFFYYKTSHEGKSILEEGHVFCETQKIKMM